MTNSPAVIRPDSASAPAAAAVPTSTRPVARRPLPSTAAAAVALRSVQ
ncbi:hypothetical protein OHA72_45495 [Dactylosporangium sp. NBC_01737]|nr:hypothetical protein OHA72_45495 [Dactylosporangium sp. NBC_01737]